MAKELNKFMSDLPPWAKGFLIVAGTGAVVFIGYKIYEANKTREARLEKKAVEDELNALSQNPKTAPTRTKADFQEMANSIFTAMDGYGTRTPEIYSILAKVRNKADWLALKAAYGVRTVSSGRGNFLNPDFTGSLPQALQEELGDSEMGAIRKTFAKKGITI